jgi:hypothetical protein
VKSNILVHLLAIATLFFGVWLFVKAPDDALTESDNLAAKPATVNLETEKSADGETISKETADFLPPLSSTEKTTREQPETTSKPANDKDAAQRAAVNPQAAVNDYILAWRNKDKAAIDRLWETIKSCDKCLLLLVDMIVNKNLEEGMMLELAIKMAALDTDIVMPVFDALIDPAGNRSSAIILSEKLMINGRPELVNKMLDIIFKMQQNGHETFAWQLTWVISKLKNHAGISPILDTIGGRAPAAPGYAEHVASVFSKVVSHMEDSESAADVIATYYQGASAEEQQRLWEVVSKHGDTLVMLAAAAERNGQHYELQQYANAIAELPHLQAADSLVKLHISMDYSPEYMGTLLAERVKNNPTIKVLHKLEDYMRNPNVPMDSRIFAAEGLLAVKNNRQARYILEKVTNNPQSAEPELQAYIGGRL